MIWDKLTRLGLALSIPVLIVVAVPIGLGLRLWPVAVHQGLPGGDSYMAILWARIIEQSLVFPAYAEISRLWLPESAPGSVYLTPALHSLVFIMKGATGASYLPIVVVFVGIVWLAILGLFFLIARPGGVYVALGSAAFLSVAGVKSFRFFFQTGFHFQNLVGDMLVLGGLLLALEIARLHGSWRRRGLLLLLLLAPVVTFFFHQLSASIMFLTMAFFLVLLVLWEPKSARGKESSGPLFLVYLLVAIAALAVLVLLLPFASETIGYAATVEPFFLTTLIPWSQYGTHLGHSLWLLGLLGTGVMILWLVLARRKKRNGKGSLTIQRLAILGISWLAATLLLSRAPEFGLNLPGNRILWYATYPLILNMVLGLSLTVHLARRGKKSRSRTARLRYGILIAAIVVIAGVATFPQVTPLLSVSPPGAESTDSTYNAETAAVVSFLKDRANGEETVWIDWVGWRSLIWVMTELVPSNGVAVRTLPGSAFYAPLDNESLEVFNQSIIGSVVVKHRRTTYSYIQTSDNTTYTPIASTTNLVLLEKQSCCAPVEIVNIELVPVSVSLSSSLAIMIVIAVVPGYLLVHGVPRLLGRRPPGLMTRMILSIPISLVIIGSLFSVFLLISSIAG